VNHKIKTATIYADSARITRQAAYKGPAVRWLHMASLPGTLDKNSLSIKVLNPSVTINQVIIEDSFERITISPEIKSKVKKLKQKYSNLLELQQSSKLTNQRLTFLQELSFKVPYNQDPSSYQSFNANTNLINIALNSISVKASGVYKESVLMKIKERELQRQIDLLHKELDQYASISEKQWRTHIYLQLSRAVTNIQTNFTYLIKHATWRPVYDIRAYLNRATGSADINFVTAGLVTQNTSEDWQDVNVTLSTISPVQLLLPSLHRWVMKEERVEAPADKSRGASDSISVGFMDKDTKKEDIASLEQESAPMEKKMKKSYARRTRSEQVKRRPMPAAKSISTLGGSDASVKINAIFPLQTIDQLYPKFATFNTKYRQLTSEAIQYRKFLPSRPSYKSPSFSSDLPVIQANGRKMEYASPFQISIKSGSQNMKVPVHAQQFKGKLTYFSIPKKDKRVFLRARTTNTSNYPLLAGKAQIFMNGSLITKSTISTVAENSFFDIDLGIDQNIETNRIVSKNSSDSGVVFKEHTTKVEVEIEVVNHHRFSIYFELQDNYPLTSNKKIKVELLDVIPQVPKREKQDGKITWKTKIKPKGKSLFKFTYKVTHPKNYIVSEFN
jgi:hypothetical protein